MHIDRLFWHIIQMELRIMSALTDLQTAVTNEDTVIASAVTLLQGLKAALDAAIASGDPAALTALSTDIGNQTAALSNAVANSTPPNVQGTPQPQVRR
jgi:hypothetical protein